MPPHRRRTRPDVPVDLSRELEWMVAQSHLLDPATSPITATSTPGDPRAVLITGENASGKSLLFRALCHRISHEHQAHAVTLSIRERSGSGSYDMARMAQAFIYGDEQTQSTGAATVRALTAALDRDTFDTPAVLGLDEPELGLSDGYAHALGAYLAGRVPHLPGNCLGLIIVTHSRTLVRAFVDELGTPPAFAHMGPGPRTLDDWLTEPEQRSIDDLLALPRTNIDTYRSMQRHLQP